MDLMTNKHLSPSKTSQLKKSTKRAIITKQQIIIGMNMLNYQVRNR